MRIIAAFFFLFMGLSIQARDTIDNKYVERYTTYFNLHHGNLTGEGAQALIEAMKASQFLLFGESHGNQQLSYLAEAMIGEMQPLGYRHFIIETGPQTAKILERELTGSQNTLADLSSLYQKYYQQVKDIPFPFFEGKADALFLDKALSAGMKLVGIDQEYYSSTLMLLDEMERQVGTEIWSELLARAKEKVIQLQLKDHQDEDFDMHQAFLDDADIKVFIEESLKKGGKVQSIAEDLLITWKIYAAYGKDMDFNLNTRADYMKALFSDYYTGLWEERSDKFFIKMGSLHTERGLTYNSVYDVGTLVSSLADLHGTQSTHLTFLFRYFYDAEEDEVFDNSEGNSQWLKEHNPFILQGTMDRWALIDLKALRRDIINRKVWVYPAVRRIAFKHDLLLIPPLARDSAPHYK